MAIEGYSGMEERWVQLMAVDELLKGCLDKKAALQAMDKEPSTISEVVQLLKRASTCEQVLRLGPKQVCQVSHVEHPLSDEDSPNVRKVTTSQVMSGAEDTTGVLQALEKMSGQLSTLLERSPASQVSRRPLLRCYSCNTLGHFSCNCPQRTDRKVQSSKKTKKKRVGAVGENFLYPH